MTTPERHHEGWRKSSFSDTGNGCVELARTLAAMRDSKNPEGPSLAVDLRGFVSVVKDDRLTQ